jgi:hypothetical protein
VGFDPIEGADNFVAMSREIVTEKSARTAHHVHNPEIRFVSPTEARVTHALADCVDAVIRASAMTHPSSEVK